MANELKMETKQAVAGLARQGFSQRRIARELGIHRASVKRLLEAAPGDADSKRAVSIAGNRPGRDSKCEPFKAKLELGLDAKRIREDLRATHAFDGSYPSVQRFVKALRESKPRRVWRMEVEPGEELQIDYGTMMLVEGENGRLRRAQLLRVTLSYSRRSYSEAMPRQDCESFVRALENAFRHFGGVPLRLCPDNLKAAVSKADWHDPHRSLLVVLVVHARCLRRRCCSHLFTFNLRAMHVHFFEVGSGESHEIIRQPGSYDSHIGGRSLFGTGS